MTAEVAVIGLGKMGAPMAARLLGAGHQVHVFNRSPQPIAELVRQGAHAAGSAAAAADRAEIVLTALPTEASVMTVYRELAEGARSGQLFVDHSTVSIGTNKACAELVAARGAGFMDAPVSGGPGGAASGTLTVMCGGSASDFDRALPVFQAFGKMIRLCGPVGSGQAVKLVNQLLVGIHTAAIAEGAVLGAKLGADPAVVLELIGSSFGGSMMLTRNLPRFMARDFKPATPVGLILKDLGIIHDEARRTGVPLFLGAIAEQRFSEAAARGWGAEDMAALVKLWEEAASTTTAQTPAKS
jgi:3-hydroxyisobutyrate dehydrogenase-like beta-hydroxyacid dehydrogenase